jgi:hypothetical protein
MQEWDHFLGIASVKRMQGLYQVMLVAQGAFSLYRTQALLQAGGWPDAIGEDIVLTRRLIRQGARVYYEPSAVAFTAAPARLIHLARQRARWARGMIEGIRVSSWRRPAATGSSGPTPWPCCRSPWSSTPSCTASSDAGSSTCSGCGSGGTSLVFSDSC